MNLRPLILSLLLLFMSYFMSAQDRQFKVVKRSNNTGDRFALVIGNSSYPKAPLANPVNDAVDMADALKKCGFEVTLLTNSGLQAMENTVRDFANSLKQESIGLLYFSGHGIQINGVNYLLPIDAEIMKESEVKYKSMSANFILEQMEQAGNTMNILILDACRDNPFARSFRSYANGLAFMDAPKGTLIVYATGPGKTAADGAGRNGTFTKHLLSKIKEENAGIMRLLQKVRQNVMMETQENQIPWEMSSLVGDFYFNFKDSQLEEITTEISKLESQLKEIEANAQKIKIEKERREEITKKEELDALLQAKKRQQEWLEKERERKEILIQEDHELPPQPAQQQKINTNDLAQEKERLEQIKKQVAERQAAMAQSIISRSEAVKEVTALEAKMKEVEKQVGVEKEDALQKLAEEYQPLKEKINQPIPPKDYFEKAADYDARVKKHKEKVEELDGRYKSDYDGIMRRFAEEEKLRSKNEAERIKELKEKKYPVEGLKFELQEYNADREIYKIRLIIPGGLSWDYYFPIEPEKAKTLYRNKDLLKIEVHYATWDTNTDLCGISILDPIAAKIPVHYRYLTEIDVKSIIKSKNFFDKNLNESGDFVNNYYRKKVYNDKSDRSNVRKMVEVVIDRATGLMWAKGCSEGSMHFENTLEWLKKINQAKYCGYNDWRLPTMEEAASLIERAALHATTHYYFHIDPIFFDRQNDFKEAVIWTGDFCIEKVEEKKIEEKYLFVNFTYGIIALTSNRSTFCHVLPVRDLTEQDYQSLKDELL